MNEFSTPLMRQYSAIKERHPNALLLFRLGDFYELFFEDAVVASKELQITLTSRNKEKGVAIPMCGVPYHAAEGYIAKLDPARLSGGHLRPDGRPALRQETGEARSHPRGDAGNGDRFADSRAAREQLPGGGGGARRQWRAWLSWTSRPATSAPRSFPAPEASARLQEELDRMRPSELLVASRPDQPAGARADPLAPITQTPLDDWVFAEEYGARLLRDHFRVATLAGYGLEGHALAVAAAGAVLHYVRETQRGSLSHLDGIRFYQQQDSLILDPATLRNLELVEPAFGESRAATLLGMLDECVTSLGARKLKAWMLRPSLDRAELEARLDVVEEFAKSTIEREELRRVLGAVQDLERLLSKVTLETAHARDLLALKQSLASAAHPANLPEPFSGGSPQATLRRGLTSLRTCASCSRNRFIPSRPCS